MEFVLAYTNSKAGKKDNHKNDDQPAHDQPVNQFCILLPFLPVLNKSIQMGLFLLIFKTVFLKCF